MLLTKQNISEKYIQTHMLLRNKQRSSSQSIFSSVISRYLALPLFGNKEKQIDNRKYVTSLPRFKNPSRKIIPLRKEKSYDFITALVLSQFIVCRNLRTRAQMNWLIGNNNWIATVWRTFRQSKRTIKVTAPESFFFVSKLTDLVTENEYKTSWPQTSNSAEN